MRALNTQVILVTGATDGLGRHVAQDLADQGATVLLHGRNPDKGAATLRHIRQATGNDTLVYYNTDFASLDNVRHLAETILAEHDRLDGLINNAGLGARAPGALRQLSRDGYERRFAVNYLAPFLLTHCLLPLLRRSAPARIVHVASVGQQPLDFDDVMLAEGYDDLRAYRQSKLAQIMFTFDQAEALVGSGVTVNALHPATLMNTPMVGAASGYFSGPMSTVEEGAEAVLYLATSPDLDGVTGQYFDGKRRARAHAQAYDAQARRRLRTLSEALTGLRA